MFTFFAKKNAKKCHFGKNLYFAENDIRPTRADVLVSLIFGFLGQETFGPKT